MKLGRFKARLREKLVIFNPYMRTILNTVYKTIFRKEDKSFRNYYKQFDSKLLIALNVGQAYFFEHIRDLVESLKENESIFPLLFSTTQWPQRRYKAELFSSLKSRYNIIYCKNLFAYPWIEESPVKAFLEVAITTYADGLRCPKILYTHGMAGLNFSKDLRHIKLLGKYTAIFLNGPLHKKALYTAQKYYGSRLPRMYEIGYLRGDRLLKMSETFKRKVFLESLQLLDLPTVVYAPTWGDFSSTSEWVDNVIDVCEDIGFNLLLRLHPVMFTGKAGWKTGGINWNDRLSNIEKKHPRVRIAMSADIDEIMLAADIMITDVSGLGLEFITMDKPVVFLPAPKYFEIYGSERPEKWCRPNYEIKNRADLRQELKKANDGDGFKFPVGELVYNRGKSLEIMIKRIEEIMRTEI